MNPSKLTTANRVAALLAAAASWAVLVWMSVVLFFPNTAFALGGLAVAVSLWGLALAVAGTVRCPKCGRRMLIEWRSPRVSPDWRALREQFFPVEAVTGRLRHQSCPHCKASVELAK